MSQTSQSRESLDTSSIPGAEVVARVRRLLVVGLVAAFGYSIFMTGSKGYCPGGVSADGSFVDAAGNATDIAPRCINLTLEPSWLVFLAVAAIACGALTMVLRRAADIHSAIRYLDRAAAAIAIIAGASVVISQIWFAMIPITDWDGTGTFFFPFPFGSVDVEIEPMQTGQ
ncbi:MAG: hypothetical protein ACOH19_08040 [Rhodoglobus sp.]